MREVVNAVITLLRDHELWVLESCATYTVYRHQRSGIRLIIQSSGQIGIDGIVWLPWHDMGLLCRRQLRKKVDLMLANKILHERVDDGTLFQDGEQVILDGEGAFRRRMADEVNAP